MQWAACQVTRFKLQYSILTSYFHWKIQLLCWPPALIGRLTVVLSSRMICSILFNASLDSPHLLIFLKWQSSVNEWLSVFSCSAVCPVQLWIIASTYTCYHIHVMLLNRPRQIAHFWLCANSVISEATCTCMYWQPIRSLGLSRDSPHEWARPKSPKHIKPCLSTCVAHTL